MTRGTKTKTPAVAVKVPQRREDASGAVARIGELNREVARLEADMNDELTAIKGRFEVQAAPLKAQVKALTEGLEIWCAAHRETIVAPGTKTADLGTGKVSWRLKPASVRITGVDAVLESLQRLGLQRFIRTKQEINKEAMQAEPDAARLVPGVAIGSAGEDFIVEPFEAELTGAAA